MFVILSQREVSRGVVVGWYREPTEEECKAHPGISAVGLEVVPGVLIFADRAPSSKAWASYRKHDWAFNPQPLDLSEDEAAQFVEILSETKPPTDALRDLLKGDHKAAWLGIQNTDNTMWCDGPHSTVACLPTLEKAEAFEVEGFEVCPKCLKLARKELHDGIAELAEWMSWQQGHAKGLDDGAREARASIVRWLRQGTTPWGGIAESLANSIENGADRTEVGDE